MDVGAAEGSDYEASGGESSEEDALSATELPKNVPVETIASARSSPLKDLQNAKRTRLRKQHNPKYLSLFQEIWDDADNSEEPSNFEVSQIGAVTWHPAEKARFFRALGKHGRHNLAALAGSVPTKSEVEIKAYLDALRQAHLERQLFLRQTHNITGAEIPAAIEIGTEVESALEKAADGLSATQEHYDYVVASQSINTPYVVTTEVAAQLDGETDLKEQARNDEDLGDETSSVGRPHELFKMSTLCDLSAKLFMVGTSDCPTNNWMSLAEAGESPSLTQDAVHDFYNIVVGESRRIVQTAIYVAHSRLRATSRRPQKPSATVRLEDVESALDILGKEQSLFDFWVRFPRRRGLKVVSGSHSKGASANTIMDLVDVELKLKEPHYRGRHSRSRSSSIGHPKSNSESVEAQSQAGSGDEMSLVEDDESQSSGGAHGGDVGSDSELDDSENDSHGASDDEHDMAAPVSGSKRKRMLEEEQDKYMEELDRQSRWAEEERLRRLLELGDSISLKREEEPLGKRPKVARKTAEEVNGWQAPHLALWEAYDLRAPLDGPSPSQDHPSAQDASPPAEQQPTLSLR